MPTINKIKKNTEEKLEEKIIKKISIEEEEVTEKKKNKFFVDLGSFSLEINAKMYIDRLKALGLKNLSYKPIFEDAERTFHIYSEEFNSIDEAKCYKTEMIGLGFIDAFIKEE